jgi:hypothetical protein
MNNRFYRILGFCLAALILLRALHWILSGGWSSNVSGVHATAYTNEQNIREQLLSYMPLGSNGKDVLAFVVDSLRPVRPADAHWEYVDAVQAERTYPIRAYTLDRTKPAGLKGDMRWPPPRTIYLLIGTYPHRWVTASVVAIWTFDDHNKLVDLTVERLMGPPWWADL